MDSKAAQRGRYNSATDTYTVPPLPPEPTTAMPGTQAKLDVMIARVEAERQSCHPGDARHSINTDGVPMCFCLYATRYRVDAPEDEDGDDDSDEAYWQQFHARRIRGERWTYTGRYVWRRA